MDNYLSNVLNICRWVAAFLVVVAHARHLTFVHYKDVVDRSLLVKGFYFMTGFGHEAVLIFFVVSGFLVGGLTIQKSKGSFDLKSYTLSRTSRIYSVLILALLLGWAIDMVGLRFLNQSEIYTNSAKLSTTSMEYIAAERLNIGAAVGNLLSLQTIVVHPLGTNGPLWSLAYEWWYYVIFGAAAVIYYSKRRIERIFSSAFILVILTFLPTELLLWGLIWLLGVGVYLYGSSAMAKPPRWIALLLFIGAALVTRLSHSSEGIASSNSLLHRLFNDFWFAASFALLLASCYGHRSNTKLSSSHGFLASFSFSTYLVHFPIYVLISAALHDRFGREFGQQPTADNIFIMALMLSLVFFLAYLFSLITERHTLGFKRFLSGRWSMVFGDLK